MRKANINKIPFKCPHGKFSCPYVDTVNIIALKKCADCEFNKLKEIINENKSVR